MVTDEQICLKTTDFSEKFDNNKVRLRVTPEPVRRGGDPAADGQSAKHYHVN